MLFYSPKSFNKDPIPVNRINWHKLEIDLTYNCKAGCARCNRACDLAPTKIDHIEINQLKSIIQELKQKQFTNIYLQGGEPFLHPDILECVKAFPLRSIKMTTRLPKTLPVIQEAQQYAKRINRSPPKKIGHFYNFHMAPIDFGVDKNFEAGCRQLTLCGRGINKWGYYSCPPGAAVDRIFGFDVGIKRIKDLTEENIYNQCKVLCRYCGLFICENPIMYDDLLAHSNLLSPSWAKALEKFKINTPRLTPYEPLRHYL